MAHERERAQGQPVSSSGRNSGRQRFSGPDRSGGEKNEPRILRHDSIYRSAAERRREVKYGGCAIRNSEMNFLSARRFLPRIIIASVLPFGCYPLVRFTPKTLSLPAPR